MNNIALPYGKGTLNLNAEGLDNIHVLSTSPYTSGLTEAEIIQEALEHPIASQRLSELSKDKKRILLITNDMTRPMPSKITIPALIREIERDNPTAQITILIASGLHRKMTKEELIDKMGGAVVEKYPVLVHDAYENDSLAYVGESPSGQPLYLNKAVLTHDLVIAEGFIEAHWLAGFSGGRKSIFPGIAGADCVMNNHSPQNVDHPNALPGNMADNPAHGEFVDAARKAKLVFILNVVLDEQKKINKAFAGDAFAAHASGCEFVRGLMEVSSEKADITISTNGGYPLDLNLYQSCKGMDTASYITKENGVIIMCSHCAEGIGHGGFARVMEMREPPKEILEKLHSGEVKIYDQWGAQVILNLLVRFKIILVSTLPRETVEGMHMIHAQTVDEAMGLALELAPENPRINVIPEGPVVITKALP